MKTLVLILFIILFSVVILYQQDVNHKEVIERFNYQDSIIMDRKHTDSLYWEHIGPCSFYDKNNFELGYDNYVKLKYDNGHILGNLIK